MRTRDQPTMLQIHNIIDSHNRILLTLVDWQCQKYIIMHNLQCLYCRDAWRRIVMVQCHNKRHWCTAEVMLLSYHSCHHVPKPKIPIIFTFSTEKSSYTHNRFSLARRQTCKLLTVSSQNLYFSHLPAQVWI